MSLKKRISIFFPFRSFHNQKFDWRVALFFILPFVFNLLILLILNKITAFWAETIKFFLSNMEIEGTILYTKYRLSDSIFYLPYLDLVADMPDAQIWWLTILITLILFVISFFLSETWTPLKYFLRIFIIILWLTLLFFLNFPVAFPYNIALYTKSGFLQIISMLFATPWIYALTYYMYGYGVFKKIGLTLFVLIYLIILAPFQYFINALIIHYYSLLFMPALFLFAGLLINVFSVIAFYAYGLSLEKLYPKYKPGAIK